MPSVLTLVRLLSEWYRDSAVMGPDRALSAAVRTSAMAQFKMDAASKSLPAILWMVSRTGTRVSPGRRAPQATLPFPAPANSFATSGLTAAQYVIKGSVGFLLPMIAVSTALA